MGNQSGRFGRPVHEAVGLCAGGLVLLVGVIRSPQTYCEMVHNHTFAANARLRPCTT